MRHLYKKIKNRYYWGERLLNDSVLVDAKEKSRLEIEKKPIRTDIINHIIHFLNKDNVNYLEIGVRNPEDNFNKINAKNKYSVDPGVEFKTNPVDFQLTSDAFFEALKKGEILDKDKKFDVVFIDGLHLAEQVERDIQNALQFLEPNGFIILHDCNPPTEIHARENYYFRLSPAMDFWNGTTWKAFYKFRQSDKVYSCCIDTDWGIGVISNKINIGVPTSVKNPFFEFYVLDQNRKDSLNLVSFDSFKSILEQSKAY
jgi:SAM-dependent methyltransferase